MLISEFREEPAVINIEMKGINKKFINGRIRNRKYCAGYCDCELHRGCLDEKQIVQHECYEKECSHFFRIIDDYYATRKNMHKETVRKEKMAAVDENTVMEKCNQLIGANDGMKIISAERKENKVWMLEYITVCSVNLAQLEQKITEEIGAVRLVRKKCDFDTSMRLFMTS